MFVAVLLSSLAVGASMAGADPVVMAAGDIACASAGTTSPGTCSQAYTSNLLLAQRASSEGLAAVLTLGDNQYDSGTLSAFNSYFGPTWGRLGSLLHPALGNHEYQTSGASGYFDYFSSLGVQTGARGQGWYSFDVGTFHLIALNSSNGCSPVSCSLGSPQEVWLKNDLAHTTQPCVIAYWHHPLSTVAGEKQIWQDFYDAGVDLVLVGHTHTYKKPVAHDANGVADPNGPREAVVGTGGKSGGIYGVIKLTLHASSYDWKFVGSGATDSGTATCHSSRLPPPVVKPTASFSATTSDLTASFADTSTGAPTSWSWDFGDGATSTAQSPSHTYAKGGTYTVTLTASNSAGSDVATQQVTVTAPPPPASGVTLVDDAKVNSGSPTSHYGTDTTLRVKTGVYRSFLRFTVNGLQGQVTGASLRLQAVTQKSPDGGSVYLVGNTLSDGVTPWTESNVTWANMPSLGTRKLGTAGPVDPAVNGGIVTIPLDASAFAGGDGSYSLALDSASTSSAYYSSKEGATAPQLLLTTGTSSTPSPPVASFTASPSSPQTNQTVTFTSTATDPDNDIVQYDWSIDGAPASGPTTTASFATAGPHTVALTVTDSGGRSDTSTKTIQVSDTAPPPGGPTVTVLGDAQVKSTSASTNYGALSTLRVRQGTSATDTTYRTYIKFQVSGLSGTVSDVKLQLHVDGASGSDSVDSGDVFLVPGASWSESTLTWNNQPALPSSPVGSAVRAPLNGTILIDLGTAITADGTYTLVLASHSTDSAIYTSKEGGAAPQLVFTTS
ncbi:MAG: CBM96 family carbohydrate-binding protein [Solirubrobacteraceae bacterium]